MGTDDDRRLRPDQRGGPQALPGLRIGLAPDRVREAAAEARLRDLAAPGIDWYRALTSAQTGDEIRLVNRSLGGRRRWELEDGSGAVIGAMAKAFNPPKGYVCERARIAWMVNRSHDPSGNKPFAPPVRDEWPVAVPEFVFVPEA